jgi:RimJ/RimL family protein N-acetyltransferase
VTACPTLFTDRLLLRPFTEADTEPFTELLQTPEVRASLYLPDGIGPLDAWQQMAMWLGQWELRGTGHWAVVERSSGQFLGRAGLHRPPRPDWPGVEIGWAFHPRHWGRGYATEAGRAAVDYAFGVLGLDEVFSMILPENTRSAAVAQRLGFTLAETRDFSHSRVNPHGVWRLPNPRSVGPNRG